MHRISEIDRPVRLALVDILQLSLIDYGVVSDNQDISEEDLLSALNIIIETLSE